ncbi:MAG: YidC/Oxa1 family membrane protein insertase [Eubacteriaceae bacterium]|jgi:YidC/Oxa1 family membrane protein insertase|nr:YidC/Oxa1 family membrane protein insertase [Eubacteriaceae bacterium]
MSILYAFFGKALFFIYNIVDSYGLAIVIFSILAKVLLLPLSIKQNKSMKIMKEIQPEMEKLQKKYADNKEKLGMEMQKLYQKHNYNPLSGCLPVLLQFPIIIALFTVLRQPEQWVFLDGTINAVDMSFLWVQNLGSPDGMNFLVDGTKLNLLSQLPQVIDAVKSGLNNGWYIFPVLSIVSQIFMTKMTMQLQSEQQQRQMKMFNYAMYGMIGYISFTFPAGLAIYWFLQTALSIVQQYYFLREKPTKEV